MYLLHSFSVVDDCLFYTVTIFTFWALTTHLFTDFRKKDYWKKPYNRIHNILMGSFFLAEAIILLLQHL